MSTPILATKLYIPAPRARAVPRPRLIERLDAGLDGKLTLISAAAGFGKTTLVSSWVAGCGLPAAWLSLDEEDSDPARFLAYLIAALQTVAPVVGQGALAALHACPENSALAGLRPSQLRFHGPWRLPGMNNSWPTTETRRVCGQPVLKTP